MLLRPLLLPVPGVGMSATLIDPGPSFLLFNGFPSNLGIPLS